MARICQVEPELIFFDGAVDAFQCQCGCGMELSVYFLMDIPQIDRRWANRLHRILSNNGNGKRDEKE